MTRTARSLILSLLLTIALALLALASPARAHEGPPFAIVMDEPAGPWRLSVWTDPDVGIATFYVILEPATDAAPPPTAADTTVRIGVQPVSGRLQEAIHDTIHEPTRQGERFNAEIPLDREEMWHITTYVTTAGTERTISTEVEATPDGKPSPLSALLTLVPFLVVGLLWLKAALRRREHRHADHHHAAPASSPE